MLNDYARLCSTSKKFRAMMKIVKRKSSESSSSHDQRRAAFALKQTARQIHKCKTLYRIPPSLAKELAFVKRFINDSSIKLETPIGHLVGDRCHEWEVAGDSCRGAGGGWLTDLRFWWYLGYIAEVVRRANLQDYSSGTFIDINCLETVVVIINLAGTIVACHEDGIDLSWLPILLNWCDNTAACSWINKKCGGGLIARALGRLFIGLLMSTKISINAKWLSTYSNRIADEISRVKKTGAEYDFSRLLLNFPQLQNCRRFTPSATLLTLIYDILLNKHLPDPIHVSGLAPHALGSLSS